MTVGGGGRPSVARTLLSTVVVVVAAIAVCLIPGVASAATIVEDKAWASLSDFSLGDGFCDDAFNLAVFQYDGGDCCSCTTTSSVAVPGTVDFLAMFNCIDPEVDCGSEGREQEDKGYGDSEDDENSSDTPSIVSWAFGAGVLLAFGLFVYLCMKSMRRTSNDLDGNAAV